MTEPSTKAVRKTRSLGDLQIAILRILWLQGEATVADVHRVLHRDRGSAPTTVATMLVKMERRGVVAHRTEGRRFVYRAMVSESEVRRSMVGELADRLFAGNPSALVAHLLSQHEIEPDELDDLRRLIERSEDREETVLKMALVGGILTTTL